MGADWEMGGPREFPKAFVVLMESVWKGHIMVFGKAETEAG